MRQCYLDVFSFSLCAFTSRKNVEHMMLYTCGLAMDRAENHFWSVLVVSLDHHETMKLSRARFLLYVKGRLQGRQ